MNIATAKAHALDETLDESLTQYLLQFLASEIARFGEESAAHPTAYPV